MREQIMTCWNNSCNECAFENSKASELNYIIQINLIIITKSYIFLPSLKKLAYKLV